jgi:hypothetical protein
MTYQDSKKIKIHKKKHPEVRKAKSSVEDILRGQGRSVDGSHSQSTFLSSTGDFIGAGESHINQIGELDLSIGEKVKTIDSDKLVHDFTLQNKLIRVQNFPVNRAGDKKTSVGINSKVTNNQLKSIKDLEAGGQSVGFAVGPFGKETTGDGYNNLTKALRGHKLL